MQTLVQRQELPISVETAWDFFSNPKNLKKITPGYMGFDILNDSLPGQIYPGMIIRYRVRPLWNVPVTWVTEITQVEAPHFFIDNQKYGPYSYWHHQHFFREIPNGVEIEDIVNYRLPVPGIGTVLERLIVKKKVLEIFEFRRSVLEQIFGGVQAP